MNMCPRLVEIRSVTSEIRRRRHAATSKEPTTCTLPSDVITHNLIRRVTVDHLARPDHTHDAVVRDLGALRFRG